MVAPGHDLMLNKWVDLSDKLSSVQNLALIGLLSLKPDLPPSIIATGDLVNGENISASEKWILTNFRKLFAFYCDKSKDTKFLVVGEAIKKVEIVKHLAPIIVSTYSVPLGIAVAFLFAAINIGLNKWCEKYARKSFSGKGTYSGNFPKRQVDGFFDIRCLPEIKKWVEDPEAFPVSGRKVMVKVPADITGRVKLPTSKDADEILFSFTGKAHHSFSFSDLTIHKQILGTVATVNQNRSGGPNILSFTTTNIAEVPLHLTTQKPEPALSPTTQEISSLDNLGRYGIPEHSSLTVTSDLASRLYLLDEDPLVIFRQARVAEGKPVPSRSQTITALKYILNMQISGKRDTLLYKKETRKIESHIVHTSRRTSSGLVCFDPVLNGEYYLVGIVETLNEEFLYNAKVALLGSNKYFLKLDNEVELVAGKSIH